MTKPGPKTKYPVVRPLRKQECNPYYITLRLDNWKRKRERCLRERLYDSMKQRGQLAI